MDINEICRSISDRYPQWSSSVSMLDIRDSDRTRTVCNDGRTIYINSRFFEDRSFEEQKFYVAQQLLHLKLNHFSRGKGHDAGLWRMASDNVVNCMLKEDGFQIPEGIYLKTDYAGKSAEETYGIFLANGEVDSQSNVTIEEIIPDSSKSAGKEKGGKIREIEDYGLAATISGLAELLEPSMQLDYDWFPGMTIKDGVLRDEFRAYPVAHAEILLDTSASVDSGLLRTFVKGVRGLMRQDAVVRVGCFDTKFYGFKDINTEQDIEELELNGSGGTDFTVAVNAFTGDAENRIIFTDGYAEMPEERVDAIWVVYGSNPIHPKGGRVLYVKPAEEKEKHEIDFLIT